jgi:hypothetical protein
MKLSLNILNKLNWIGPLCGFMLLSSHGAAFADSKVQIDKIQDQNLTRALLDFEVVESTPYTKEYVDLNGDDVPEAIVYLVGPHWCGSGGCTLLILKQESSKWQVMSKIPTVNTPIQTLASKGQQWQDLAVIQVGGGELTPKTVLINFKAGKYAKRGTVSLESLQQGKVVIPEKPQWLYLGS